MRRESGRAAPQTLKGAENPAELVVEAGSGTRDPSSSTTATVLLLRRAVMLQHYQRPPPRAHPFYTLIVDYCFDADGRAQPLGLHRACGEGAGSIQTNHGQFAHVTSAACGVVVTVGCDCDTGSVVRVCGCFLRRLLGLLALV